VDGQSDARRLSQCRLGCRDWPWLSAFAWGSLRHLATGQRTRLFFIVVCASSAVTLIKGISKTSCPWDLQAFGGTALYISHWNVFEVDGGGGHCFPAGHASTGFAFMAAYFSLRQAGAPAARIWLPWRRVGGLGLRAGEQVAWRPLHEPHLWTAWLCWTVGWLSHWLFSRLRGKF